MAENKPILGELLKGGEERDAIHIAILPATAGDYISPGARINVRPDGWAILQGDPNAIADPFLPGQIYPGQQFYALLFPYTIESLRHEWVHRDFPRPSPPPMYPEAEKWLRDFAEDHYVNFNEMMTAADDLVKGHSDTMDICFGMDVDYNERQEFWEYYGRLKGQFIPNSVKDEYFSCSC